MGDRIMWPPFSRWRQDQATNNKEEARRCGQYLDHGSQIWRRIMNRELDDAATIFDMVARLCNRE